MIRPATSQDRSAVEAVVGAAYGIYLEQMEKPPGPMLDDYGRLIDAGQVSLAENGGQVEAIIVLIAKPDHLLLDNIAVDPAAQHHGLGRQLIAFAEAEARRLGHAELRLYTHEKMVENIAWYGRLGFEETGRAQADGYDRVFMRKSLG